MAEVDTIVQFIKDHQSFLILTHLSPDGDAVGSCLALSWILSHCGKSVACYHQQPIPHPLNRLPGIDRWQVRKKLSKKLIREAHGIFIIECPRLNRTGYDHVEEGFIINIDHHISNQRYGQIVWVQEDIPCIGISIYQLGQALGLTFSPPVTDWLYAALITDTGRFSYANATPEAFQFAAELVEKGTRPDHLAALLYEGYTFSQVTLKAWILTTLTLHQNGKLATMEFPRCFLSRVNAQSGDAEGVIDEARKIEGVEVAVLFRETEEGDVKVSMRSQGNVNVEPLALRYGGGGHPYAAGFNFPGTLKEAKKLVLQELKEWVDHENGRTASHS